MDRNPDWDHSTPTNCHTGWMSRSSHSICSVQAQTLSRDDEMIQYAPITEVLDFISKPLDYLSTREVSFLSFRRQTTAQTPSSAVLTKGSDQPSPVGENLESDASHSFQYVESDISNLTNSRLLCTTQTSNQLPETPHHAFSATARTDFVSAVKSNRLDDLRRAVLHSQVMIDDFRPIVYASIKGFDGIVSYFYTLGDSLSVDEFHTVARYGQNPSILKTILKHIDVNAKNDLGGCALFFSLVSHNYKMADYLMTATTHVDLNPVDSDGFTMTRAFLYLGDKEVVSWMISRGYRFDNADDQPLETAILGMNPSVDLVKIFLENSAPEFAVLEARNVLKKLNSSELLSNPTIRNIFRLLKRYSFK